ncbi:MAG: hypothetical protein KC978_09150 [Candidatus Omnitrophica bacterium]|nr:hypothetical protein [Candidatus Omnitrophota bacterium]
MSDNLASPSSHPPSKVAFVLVGALAMSYGWGFRGDYGHEAGAMVPGALLGMALCLCSGREDWIRRTAIAGWLGAIGWGIGGQVSYGMIPSYTISDSFPDVLYGYSCLFLVGALWGGIGAAILSFAWTKSQKELATFIGPTFALGSLWCLIGALFWIPEHVHETYSLAPLDRLTAAGESPPIWLSIVALLERFSQSLNSFTVSKMHDIDWLGAMTALSVAGLYAAFSKRSRKACGLIAILAIGWWVGYLILVRLFDLHMQPKPGGTQRSDNWAGMAGLLVALVGWMWREQDRVGLLLSRYGFIGGGIGFSVGDFINKPDKIRWEPIYQFEFLRGFDHWKWTEQGFGLIMGAIVSLGVLHLLKSSLEPTKEEAASGGFMTTNEFSVIGLLGVTLWWNFYHNPGTYFEHGRIAKDTLFGMKAPDWLFLFGFLYLGLLIHLMLRNRRADLPFLPSSWQGRGQLLFLFYLWVTVVAVVSKSWPLMSHGALFVHGSFCITALACTWIVLTQPAAPTDASRNIGPVQDREWRSSPLRLTIGATGCIVLLLVLTMATMSMQEGPGDGFRYRFGPNADHLREINQP